MNFKHIFFKLARVLKAHKYTDLLIKTAKQNVVFPFYHTVSDKKLVHIGSLYQAKSSKSFIKELDFLLKHYQPLHPNEFYQSVNNGKTIKKPSFLLSFDDGLSEFHHTIAPLLKAKGIPAINFLNPAFLDNKDMMYRYKIACLVEYYQKNKKEFKNDATQKILKKHPGETIEKQLWNITYHHQDDLNRIGASVGFSFDNYLRLYKPYLSIQEIVKLKEEGFVFGAHSVDHPPYYQLNQDDQLKQTVQSIDKISQILDAPTQFFSFPFTDKTVNKTFFDDLIKSFPDLITFGTAGMKLDSIKNHFQRIPMDVFDRGQDILAGEQIYFILKSLLDKNTINRK